MSLPDRVMERATARRINAAVAERLLGATVHAGQWEDHMVLGNGLLPVPDYCGDMAAAWRLVEHLRARGIFIDVDTLRDGYEARASREGGDGEELWHGFAVYTASTAPLAICRAALSAVSSPAPRGQEDEG
jgi:hypothetical protein